MATRKRPVHWAFVENRFADAFVAICHETLVEAGFQANEIMDDVYGGSAPERAASYLDACCPAEHVL